MRSTGLAALILLWVPWLGGKAASSIRLIEGWARVDIVVATSDVVVCSKRVSGQADELFALDTVGKRMLWREDGYVVTRGETDGRGNFLTVEPGNKLVSRKLKNGQVNWQKDIRAAAPGNQSQDPLPSDPNSAWSGGTRYKYRGPFIRGQKAFVFRQAREGYVDLWTRLFDDWLVFDTADGQLLHHGAGACVGLAGDVLVVTRDDNSIAAVNSSDYSQREVYRKETPGRLASHPMDQSSGGRCIFIITDIPASVDRAAVYDSSSGKLTVFAPVEKPKLEAGWILLSNYVVWYSVTGRIEVYDLEGKLARKYKLELATDTETGKLVFAGTSGNGSLIFRRGQRLLLFDVPSLELTSNVKRTANAAWGDIFIKRGSDIVYSVEGSTSLEKMGPDAMPHKLTANLVSLKTGETLWAYTEEVVMRKKQPEP